MNFVRIHELFEVKPLRSALCFRNNLYEHVISLERGDFKLSIGSSNNKFSYMVEGLLNILQSAQHGSEKCKAESYEPKLEKKTSETGQ